MGTTTTAYANGQLTASTNPENGTVTHTYLATGQPYTKIDAKSNKEVYTYDGFARLISIHRYTNLTTPAGVDYFYFDATPGGGNYSQNAAGRLAQRETALTTDASGQTMKFIEDFSYTVSGLPTNKRLTVYKETSQGSRQASLEATYGYDGEGGLLSMTYPSSHVPAGRLATYRIDTISNGTMYFVEQTRNVWFGSRLLRTGPAATPTKLATDRLGSIRLRQTGANPIEYLTYAPYGEQRSGPAGEGEKFGTYYRDQTGLDYADQRYYLSAWGRFGIVDPAGDGRNWYSYVGGDPVSFRDPSGLALSGEWLNGGATFCAYETAMVGDVGFRRLVGCSGADSGLLNLDSAPGATEARAKLSAALGAEILESQFFDGRGRTRDSACSRVFGTAMDGTRPQAAFLRELWNQKPLVEVVVKEHQAFNPPHAEQFIVPGLSLRNSSGWTGIRLEIYSNRHLQFGGGWAGGDGITNTFVSSSLLESFRSPAIASAVMGAISMIHELAHIVHFVTNSNGDPVLGGPGFGYDGGLQSEANQLRIFFDCAEPWIQLSN